MTYKFNRHKKKLHDQPLLDDHTYDLSFEKKLLRVRPLKGRVLAKIKDCYYSDTIIVPEIYRYSMESQVIAVGDDCSGLRIGDKIIHLHRCGFQIGFYHSQKKYRIIPVRQILARL